MAKSGAIQTAIIQAAIQATKVAVLTVKEAEAMPTLSTSIANEGEKQRPKYGRPALRQPSLG